MSVKFSRQSAADFFDGVDAADQQNEGGEGVSPPRKPAPEQQEVAVGHQPEEHAERDHAADGTLAADAGRQPGHRSPEQRVVRDIQRGEDEGVDPMPRAVQRQVVPERRHALSIAYWEAGADSVLQWRVEV